MYRSLLKLAATGMLVSAATAALAQSDVYNAANHNYTIETVADGLVHPWSMAWLPGGDMLVTEKPGRLRIIRNGVLLPEAIPGTPEVFYEGQGGLFDVVPHPNFSENNWVYLSFAKPVTGGSTTAVVRGQLENDLLSNVTEIFSAQASGFGHYGGKIVFDNDGYMFLTLGDRMAPPTGDLTIHPAQDLSNHHGVTIRLHDDGRVPTDNPFVGKDNALPEIWSYGHRSPQGLAIHPETGDLWESEHGPQGGDELNRIEPGNNYGWPVVGRGVNYGEFGRPIHVGISEAGMTAPAHFWVPSIATSGLMVYTGDKFPLWYGNIFSGSLAGEQLARLQLSDDYRRVLTEETLAYGLGRIRDVRQGPDGYIYLAVEDRAGAPTAIVRMEPAN
ncbi:MAG: PQQ-dependent sugar dehydrogenase [Gammaproteobacteria bacterium]|nr:PQQ-dependent sugar dehydrogenase [Gammaproteobacteria bacterium]